MGLGNPFGSRCTWVQRKQILMCRLDMKGEG